MALVSEANQFDCASLVWVLGVLFNEVTLAGADSVVLLRNDLVSWIVILDLDNDVVLLFR